MSSDLVFTDLARWIFGLSASFHFLFVPLSIGLVLCVNILQTTHVMHRDPALKRAANFWSRFVLLVWGTGVLTGYPLRMQLASNWGDYLQEAKPVFDAIFQIEGFLLWPMVILMVSYTLLRRWLPTAALMVMGWLLLLVMLVQSLSILAINAWMQVPDMLPFGPHGWQVHSLWPILTHPTTLQKFWHTMSAAMLCGAFFLFAVCALLMRRGRDLSAARASMRVAIWVGLLAALSAMLSGHESANGIAQRQPLKFAAFEGHWHAEDSPAPLVLWAIPNERTGANHQEISIPFLMSLLRDGTLQSPPGILDLTHAWGQHYLADISPSKMPADGQELARSIGATSGDAPLLAELGLTRLSLAVARQHGDSWRTLDPQSQALAVKAAATPPVKSVFYFFRAMVACGVVSCLLCFLAFWFRKPLCAGEMPVLMNTLAWAAPTPWVATLSGWAVCELGRQPWAIYGYLPTVMAGQVGSASVGVLGLLQVFAAGMLISLLFASAVRTIFRSWGRVDATTAGLRRRTSLSG